MSIPITPGVSAQATVAMQNAVLLVVVIVGVVVLFALDDFQPAVGSVGGFDRTNVHSG